MALEAPALFNFYFRYAWDQNNFNDWQSGMVSLERGAMEGLFEGAVLGGFDLTAVSGMVLQASTGIAVGPTGYLMVMNSANNLIFTPPVSNPRLDLIVVRPLLTNTGFITRPTTPFDSVPLKVLQDCQVIVIQGTEGATPDYPAAGVNDVVIAGIRLTAAMSAFTDPKYDGDFNKREIMGKRSNFQQNFGRYDDRLRPVKNTFNSLAIFPSQLIHPNSRAFSFVNKTMPSIFPKSGGLYNHAQTFLNFLTGAISGGDTTSSAFTPTIPAAGTFINATVGITTNDTIQVAYGVAGTHTQCFDGISNQSLSSSAGGVAILANAKPIAIVTLGSLDGVNINTLEYVDCRGVVGTGSANSGMGSSSMIAAALPYTITAADNGRVLEVNTSTGPGSIQLPTPNGTYIFTVTDIGGSLNNFPVTLLRSSGEKINNIAASFLLNANNGSWTFKDDGTNWWNI